MFKNINFDTKRYLILLSLVCIVFFIIVVKAFEYLPVSEDKAVSSSETLKNINSERVEQPDQTGEEQSEEAKPKKEQKRGHIDLMKPANVQILPEIQAPDGVDYEPSEEVASSAKEEKTPELSSEEKAVQALYRAQNCYTKGQYNASIEQYRSVLKLTSDTELVASVYEGIAQVYAANRKYGTALSFATKAYSISPSSSREMLLARLYYKTGDIEKATKRINNVLHRDFAYN